MPEEHQDRSQIGSVEKALSSLFKSLVNQLKKINDEENEKLNTKLRKPHMNNPHES